MTMALSQIKDDGNFIICTDKFRGEKWSGMYTSGWSTWPGKSIGGPNEVMMGFRAWTCLPASDQGLHLHQSSAARWMINGLKACSLSWVRCPWSSEPLRVQWAQGGSESGGRRWSMACNLALVGCRAQQQQPPSIGFSNAVNDEEDAVDQVIYAKKGNVLGISASDPLCFWWPGLQCWEALIYQSAEAWPGWSNWMGKCRSSIKRESDKNELNAYPCDYRLALRRCYLLHGFPTHEELQ